jgi:hypothetical protein
VAAVVALRCVPLYVKQGDEVHAKVTCDALWLRQIQSMINLEYHKFQAVLVPRQTLNDVFESYSYFRPWNVRAAYISHAAL